jgi:hypothetical protein
MVCLKVVQKLDKNNEVIGHEFSITLDVIDKDGKLVSHAIDLCFTRTTRQLFNCTFVFPLRE